MPQAVICVRGEGGISASSDGWVARVVLSLRACASGCVSVAPLPSFLCAEASGDTNRYWRRKGDSQKAPG
jgi:hypothetical protein